MNVLSINKTIRTDLLSIGLMTCLMSSLAYAEVRLPHLLSDNMVLRREMPIPVWGWANPNEKVTVRLGKSSASATAGTNGQWSVKLPKMSAGGPYQLTVTGVNTLTLNNVMIGEVWLCSGQSNMHWTMYPGWGVVNNDAEVAAANYPNIRMFTVAKSGASKMADDADGVWLPISPANLMVGGGGRSVSGGLLLWP